MCWGDLLLDNWKGVCCSSPPKGEELRIRVAYGGEGLTFNMQYDYDHILCMNIPSSQHITLKAK